MIEPFRALALDKQMHIEAGFAIALVLFILGAMVEPAIPALFKKLIDSGFKDGLDYPLWMVPVVIIGLFLLRGVLNFSATYAVQSAIGQIVLSLRV